MAAKVIAEYSAKSDDDGPHWAQGRIEEDEDDPAECENCQKSCTVYAATWLQGRVGDPATMPDTFVVCECIPCFFGNSHLPIIFGDQYWRAGVITVERGGQ